MKCADQVGGACELGEIEFKDGGLGAEDADGDLGKAEGFFPSRAHQKLDNKELGATLPVLVHGIRRWTVRRESISSQ